MPSYDYLLVGGGLQNALLASALVTAKPSARIAVVESGPRLGGNHVWCFHALDIADEASPFVEPFVVQRWSRYQVKFPGLSRTLEEPYAAVSSQAVHDVLSELAAKRRLELRLGQRAASVEPGRVALSSGETLTASVVIDARGPDGFDRSSVVGYQKFSGLELEVKPGSAPAEPMLMDCTVAQTDGLRFFYVLPLARDRVLVEDTYFSDGPELDEEALQAEIAAYSASAGLEVRSVLRTERGVLPLPERASVEPPVSAGLVRGGYQGGWFHPTTGYSFPLAVRFARVVANASIGEVAPALRELSLREARQQRFAALLNRMLFQAFAPEQRYRVLERFYRLPAPTVRRFYALSLTRADRARVLCGRPPRGLSPRGLVSALRGARATPRPLEGRIP